MDIFARIAQDEKDYRLLCQHYGEEIQYRHTGMADCYGSHARLLLARELADAMREVRNRESC